MDEHMSDCLGVTDTSAIGSELSGLEGVRNLYIHFPFCRSKCTYCALHSRAGSSADERARYVARIAEAIREIVRRRAPSHFLSTVYFGGGTPALCDLAPLFDALAPLISPAECEFTVELNPLDVSSDTLAALKGGGVNRVSMGVQSLDDHVLAKMGRGYTFHDAERAFYLIKESFENAGVDFIAGYPGEEVALSPRYARLAKWGLAHCSVYSLILEENSILGRRVKSGIMKEDDIPGDDETLNRVALMARLLSNIGLERYEISSHAVPGFECRHNLAVWRGEDYIGLGDGAYGRIGLKRTIGMGGGDDWKCQTETVTYEADRKERSLFRLRTREGIDASAFPQWTATLDKFTDEALLERTGTVYRLTERGTEVCDTILSELV